MYNDERNKTLSELRKRTLFRRFAFILLFVILAGSLAGVGSLLFSNSSITDEAGRGEAEVEVAAIGGSGTSASPWIITTKADLQAWAGSSSYWAANTYTQLAADIDWGGSGGGNYPRVVDFAGTFDGKNHVVKNLYINSTTGNTGFICSATGTATIKNLGIVGGSVTGSSYVAGICGSGAKGSKILDCFNTATITATGNYAGGILGYSPDGGNAPTVESNCAVVERCFNTGTISSAYAGGISGNQGMYKNCFNAGSVIGSSHAAGMGAWGTAYDCYNVGFVAADSNGNTNQYIGGLISGWGARSERSYTAGNGIQRPMASGSTTTSTNTYYNSNKGSGGAMGTSVTQANMIADNTLSSSMSGLGSAFIKRPNDSTTDQTKMYYPELAAFANHSWKAMQDYSKASVRVSGYVDPGYKKNDAPTCTANTAITDVPWIGNGTK